VSKERAAKQHPLVVGTTPLTADVRRPQGIPEFPVRTAHGSRSAA
jgi:hypothetical protein